MRFFLSLILISFIIAPIQGFADVIFEAYYRVMSSDIQIGYIIERIEFDKKKAELAATSYTKLKLAEIDSTESLKARAGFAKLNPISFEYTYASNNSQTKKTQLKKIEAQVKKDTMIGKVSTESSERKINTKIMQNTYLSVFLPYVLINSKQMREGLKPETSFNYKAIDEESGEIHDGTLMVKSTEEYQGIKVFKVLNNYNKEMYVNMMTVLGESLVTRMPKEQMQVQMVKTKDEAVKDFNFSNANISLLFGNIPVGKENSLYKDSVKTAKSLEKVLEEKSEQQKE